MNRRLKKIFSNFGIAIIITVGFLLWIVVFDRDSYMDIRELDERIEKMESEIDFYRRKITEDSTVIVRLRDSAYVEKFARENFQKKREDETVFIVK